MPTTEGSWSRQCHTFEERILTILRNIAAKAVQTYPRSVKFCVFLIQRNLYTLKSGTENAPLHEHDWTLQYVLSWIAIWIRAKQMLYFSHLERSMPCDKPKCKLPMPADHKDTDLKHWCMQSGIRSIGWKWHYNQIQLHLNAWQFPHNHQTLPCSNPGHLPAVSFVLKPRSS